jgi:antirestriction protein ArdC
MTDVYLNITNHIIEVMETVDSDCRRLWDTQPSIPENLVTGKRYSGINIMTLWCAAAQASKAHTYIRGEGAQEVVTAA